MTGLASSSWDIVGMSVLHDPNADQTAVYKNFTPPGIGGYMYLTQNVSSEDVETQRLDLMPGFRFSWWYSGAEVTPDNKYKDEELNKQFVRLAENLGFTCRLQI